MGEWLTVSRGVNSLQILSYIAAAQNLSGDPTGSFEAAYNVLTNATNQVCVLSARLALGLMTVQYNQNIINLKIEVPEDDNYSDDELSFLPYYAYFTNSFDPVKVSEHGPFVLLRL